MKTIQLCTTVLACLLATVPVSSVSAEVQALNTTTKTNIAAYDINQIRVIGEDPQSQRVQEVLAVFQDLLDASNRHAIEDVLRYYSPKFISGDNLTLEQLKNLILETWKSYPDIRYVSKPVELRINDTWATLETLDESYATAPADKEVLDIPGKLKSRSRSQLFFRRSGNTWEIMSDATIWEEAQIRYGIGDEIKITLSAPEQVKAGENYSATIIADIPQGAFTIATIDNQPLTYPHEEVDDKFRPLGGESNSLQRVLRANTINHNEIVTATLGLTGVEQNNPERPSYAVNGIATIVRRVNVVPISKEDMLSEMEKKELVKTPAGGKPLTLDNSASGSHHNVNTPAHEINFPTQGE